MSQNRKVNRLLELVINLLLRLQIQWQWYENSAFKNRYPGDQEYLNEFKTRHIMV